MHNIQKSFPFPVASECQSSSILELWVVVVVVTWFSFAKHNYPIVGGQGGRWEFEIGVANYLGQKRLNQDI